MPPSPRAATPCLAPASPSPPCVSAVGVVPRGRSAPQGQPQVPPPLAVPAPHASSLPSFPLTGVGVTSLPFNVAAQIEAAQLEAVLSDTRRGPRANNSNSSTRPISYAPPPPVPSASRPFTPAAFRALNHEMWAVCGVLFCNRCGAHASGPKWAKRLNKVCEPPPIVPRALKYLRDGFHPDAPKRSGDLKAVPRKIFPNDPSGPPMNPHGRPISRTSDDPPPHPTTHPPDVHIP